VRRQGEAHLRLRCTSPRTTLWYPARPSHGASSMEQARWGAQRPGGLYSVAQCRSRKLRPSGGRATGVSRAV